MCICISQIYESPLPARPQSNTYSGLYTVTYNIVLYYFISFILYYQYLFNSSTLFSKFMSSVECLRGSYSAIRFSRSWKFLKRLNKKLIKVEGKCFINFMQRRRCFFAPTIRKLTFYSYRHMQEFYFYLRHIDFEFLQNVQYTFSNKCRTDEMPP